MLKNIKINTKRTGCQLNVEQGKMFNNLYGEVTLVTSPTAIVIRALGKRFPGVRVLDKSLTQLHWTNFKKGRHVKLL